MGVLVAAGVAVAPAIGARESADHPVKRLALTRSVGAFTPASADPKLAALLARAGLGLGGFHFTPSDSLHGNGRAVTVAVRARSTASAGAVERSVAVAEPTVGLAPIAYNLGVAVGWRRFALAGDVSRVDMAGAPGSREVVDLGLSYAGRKVSGQVKAVADLPLENTPKLIEGPRAYSIDMGGSYALSRNLDVTAGVRYKSERDRLQRLADDRRDSQAVYIGTAFRF